jgi:hypothetical protein
MYSKPIQFIGTSPEELTENILEGIDKKLENFRAEFKSQEEEVLMTVEETMKFLKCSKQALWTWNKNGILPSNRLGNRVYYRRSDIFNSLIKQK